MMPPQIALQLAWDGKPQKNHAKSSFQGLVFKHTTDGRGSVEGWAQRLSPSMATWMWQEKMGPSAHPCKGFWCLEVEEVGSRLLIKVLANSSTRFWPILPPSMWFRFFLSPKNGRNSVFSGPCPRSQYRWRYQDVGYSSWSKVFRINQKNGTGLFILPRKLLS